MVRYIIVVRVYMESSESERRREMSHGVRVRDLGRQGTVFPARDESGALQL